MAYWTTTFDHLSDPPRMQAVRGIATALLNHGRLEGQEIVALARSAARSEAPRDVVKALNDIRTPLFQRGLPNSPAGLLNHQPHHPSFPLNSLQPGPAPRKKAETRATSPAAATVPHPSKYTVGDHSSHPMFGDGVVMAIDANKLTIDFTNKGVKKIIDDYVKPASREPGRNLSIDPKRHSPGKRARAAARLTPQRRMPHSPGASHPQVRTSGWPCFLPCGAIFLRYTAGVWPICPLGRR